jgi:hypothetical protein
MSGREPPTLGALGVGTGGALGGAVGVGIDGAFGVGLDGTLGVVRGISEPTCDGFSDVPSALCSVGSDRGAPQRPTSIVLVVGSGFAEL